MRIASGGVQHETNTFAATPTTLADFVRDSDCGPQLSGGDTIRQRYRGTGCIHGGYLAGAESAGLELLPLLCAKAQPSGVVVQSAFDKMLEMFLVRLREAGPIDGVLLDLHGAMVTEEHQDAEGAFIRAVREQVGELLPIIVTLDLHANITPQMAELSNCIIGYDTYPHVDMHERGREAAELMAATVRGDVRLTQQYRQLPLITMPPMQCTLREPMQSLIHHLHQMEQEEGVLTATVSMGFPFADIRDAGVSVLVTTDDDPQLAGRKCDDLAGRIWNLRDRLQPQLTTIEQVIRFVDANPTSGLTIFADGSDNPGGGVPCDGTVALRAMIDARFQGGGVALMYDPEVVEQAHQLGVGATIANLRLGGKTDDQHGAPVEAQAAGIRALSDGQFRYGGAMAHGLVDSLGKTATLDVDGVTVVVTSRRRQCIDREMLRVAGVEPDALRLLVLKSAVHFRADFSAIATHVFDADTPGIHRPDFANYDYQQLRRPIYPLDEVS